MNSREQAELKDDILLHLKEFGNTDVEVILDCFIERPTEKNFNLLIDELLAHGLIETDVLTKQGHRVKLSYKGSNLIENGGFVRLNQEMLQEAEKLSSQATQEQRIQNLREENLRLTNTLSEEKIRTHWIPILTALGGVLIALGSLIYTIYSNSNKDEQTQLQKDKIETLEKSLKSLEGSLIKENKELKDELLKAQMLISIYEGGVK